MAQFRKKPVVVVIEAVQWTGNNTQEMRDFMGTAAFIRENGGLLINTLEDQLLAQPNDWIIKRTDGEFYPIKNDIFEKTYEPVIEEN